MQHVPTLVLYRVPVCLSPDWQRVFDSLVKPLHTVRCLLFDPILPQMSEDVLRGLHTSLRHEKQQFNQTLDSLYAVAPKTYDVGWAIRIAVDPIAARVYAFLHVKVPATPSLTQSLINLAQEGDAFPERQLLVDLHEAVMAEKGINLTAPVRPPTDDEAPQETVGPLLDEAMLAVLRHLDESAPILQVNVDIEQGTELGKRTVGNAVCYLIEHDLANRPRGERKGSTITRRGKEFLAQIGRGLNTGNP
jgi:hypothetical protein